MHTNPDSTGQPDTSGAPDLDGGLSRRSVLQYAGGAAVALSGAGILAGCGSSSESDEPDTKATPPKRGGRMVVAMISPGSSDTLSPWAAVSLAAFAGVFNIYDPLFEFDDKGELRPGLAESMEPNADATVWTVKLRDGVKWHDGKPLTADDVVYTVKKWVSPDNYFSSSLSGIMDGKGVRKRGPLTVEIPLLRPVADFPYMTANFLCRVVQDGTTGKDFNTKPIGTGPFKLVSYKPGDQTVLEANREYWREGRPYLDELVLNTSFTDDAARVNALQSGLAHVAPEMPWGVARANASSNVFRVSSAPSPNTFYFAMNVSKAPFNDDRVQKALKLLADRPEITKTALAGYGRPANDLCGPGLKNFASDLKRERDVEQARALLRQAGQSDLKVQLDTSAVVPGAIDFATLFARQAADGGVKVDVNRITPNGYYLPESGYLTRRFAFTMTASSQSLSVTYLQSLWSGGAYNENHFSDKRYEALFFDAMGELDPARSKEKWHAVQEIQFERGGNLVFSQRANVDGYRNEVGGVEATFAGASNGFLYRDAYLST